ncbi:MAG: hypothetical protein E6Q98_02660 [Rhodospirillaceae bacterium]|nr:MAG: hypothetical protein E6Q98_02660 [Rhodospirillaceae bacterium]
MSKHDENTGGDDNRGMAQTLARARAAVEALARDYINWARADIDACQKCLDQAVAQPDQRETHIRTLFAVAHNIKGQGTSFGYPLMTRIGQSLCHLTRTGRPFADGDLSLIAAHLAALRQVLEKTRPGDDNAGTEALAAELEERVARAEAG